MLNARAHNAEHEVVSRFDMLSQRVRQALIGERDWGRIVALCVEPGMGSETLIRNTVEYWSSRGLNIERLNLSGKTSAAAVGDLVRLSHLVTGRASGGGRSLAVVVGVPAPDECDVEQQAQALQEMAQAGCMVLLFLYPEAEALLEELDDVVRIGSDDLLRCLPIGNESALVSYSHGIPVLVEALEQPDGGIVEGDSLPADYRSALSVLVSSCVRLSLPAEDRRIRLAMLLLGSGTADDVIAVSDRLDDDTWIWLEHDAPLFGVDSLAESFSCAGLCTIAGLNCCRRDLRAACEQMPDIVAKATRVLASRGDMKRAAITCGMCCQSEAMELACEWGVEFVCAGEDALVIRALEQRAGCGLAETESSEMASIAVSVLSDVSTRIKVRALPPLGSYRGPSALRRRRRYVELLQACRDVDRGVEPGRVAFPHDDDDDMAQALVEHLQARRLLFSGKFARAHAMLVDNAMRLQPSTLVAALLCDDYEVARSLIGEEQSVADRRAVSMAAKVFDHMHTDRLSRYREALADLTATLSARHERASFAVAIGHADKMGDQAIRAVLLVAAAVSDIRRRAFAAAHVHALYVTEMAGGLASDYVVSAARFLDALVQAHLKDETSLRELSVSRQPSPVSDMALLATMQNRPDGADVGLRSLSDCEQPRDELWMLNVVLNDFDGDVLSQRFRLNAPEAWAFLSRGVVRRAEKHRRAMRNEAGGTRVSLGDALSGGHLLEAGESHGMPRRATRVELKVLGGIRVLLDGEDITRRLSRRRVKSYLLLLAAVPGHELSVFDVMDSLWPGIDLMAGRQRVYSANSELRKVLGRTDASLEMIQRSRGEGTVKLDTSVVSVDVDEFVRVANAALRAPGDDELVLRLASEATLRYLGDVASSSYDAHGLIDKRRQDLRELYVDVAVAGARAAISLGKLAQGIQLARGAHGANEMREDVIAVVIRALRAAGRNADACLAYDTYARQLLSREGRPPAPTIRHLIEDVYHSPHSGAVTRQSERHEDLLLI